MNFNFSFIQTNQICKTKIFKFKNKFNHLYLPECKSSSTLTVCRWYIHEQLSEAAIHRHICNLCLTFMHNSALSKPISMLIMSNPEVDLFFWWTPRMSAHKVCRDQRKNSFVERSLKREGHWICRLTLQPQNCLLHSWHSIALSLSAPKQPYCAQNPEIKRGIAIETIVILFFLLFLRHHPLFKNCTADKNWKVNSKIKTVFEFESWDW